MFCCPEKVRKTKVNDKVFFFVNKIKKFLSFQLEGEITLYVQQKKLSLFDPGEGITIFKGFIKKITRPGSNMLK